mmetsp:Transcript_408/g.610  ORF Transcript_408/g.610 Transcript_408/m.610 type:complete len:91 (+) Transcript_408:452-724(+)
MRNCYQHSSLLLRGTLSSSWVISYNMTLHLPKMSIAETDMSQGKAQLVLDAQRKGCMSHRDPQRLDSLSCHYKSMGDVALPLDAYYFMKR